MWKRILGVVAVALILALAYLLIRPHYRLPFDPVPLVSAVPANTGALLRLPTLTTELTDSSAVPLWFLDAKRVENTLRQLTLLEEVEWESWWLVPTQGEGPTVAAYAFIGMSSGGLNAAWNPDQYGPSTASSAGEVFIHQQEADDPLYFGRHHNLLVAGNFSFQVESILSAAKGEIPAWEDDEDLQALLKDCEPLLEPNDRTQLILNTQRIASSLPSPWFNPDQLRFWQQYTDWLFFDFEVLTETSCQLSAYSRSTEQFLANGDPSAWQWVPEVADLAMPIPVTTDDVNLQNGISSWIDEAAWSLSLARPQVVEQGAEIWVLPIGDTSAYRRFQESVLGEEMLTDQRSYQVYDLMQLQTGKGFELLTDRQHWQPWVVETSEALVVGVFREDLERWLDYHLVNGILLDQEFFLALKAALPDEQVPAAQGFVRWGPLADAETHLLHLLFPGAKWAREGGASFVSFTTKNDNLRSVIQIGEVPERSLPATIRWTLPLTGNEELQLFPVQELGAADVQYYLVQAASGSTWLIDLNGTIIWEQENTPPLYSPVWHWRSDAGDPHWGATSQQGLHVWDEDGRGLQLPVISAVPAAGLSLFSFDSRGTPVLAYPNRNTELELRDLRGQLLEGWPAKLSGTSSANLPLVHWQTETEDLILAWSDTEGWQFFSRKGAFLYSLPTVPEPFLGQPGYDFDPLQPRQSRLMGATSTGKVNVWDLEGNIVPIPLGRGPLNRWLFHNCWGDNRPDYVAQRGNLVHLYGFEGSAFGEQWQQRFASPPDTLLSAEPVGTLVLNKQEQKIWLIDNQGQIPTAFPLAGKESAHLAETATGDFVLVTLLDGQVYAYDLVLNN